jgi:hypothetical protein
MNQAYSINWVKSRLSGETQKLQYYKSSFTTKVKNSHYLVFLITYIFRAYSRKAIAVLKGRGF